MIFNDADPCHCRAMALNFLCQSTNPSGAFGVMVQQQVDVQTGDLAWTHGLNTHEKNYKT